MSLFGSSFCHEANCQNNRNLHPMLLWHAEQGGAGGRIVSDFATLYKMTEEDVQNTINWYLNKKRWKSRMSQWLRALAILFGALGTLCPVWPADLEIFDIETVKIGYVLYAIAASFLAADKFFGFSFSWMRMIQTELRIQQKLVKFQGDWLKVWCRVANDKPTHEQEAQLLEVLNKFRQEVVEEMCKEANTWIQEFQSSLANFDTQLNNSGSKPKP